MIDKMYLEIDENYAIRTDPSNWILSKKTTNERGWINQSYFGTLPQVLKEYVSVVLKDEKVESIDDLPKKRSLIVQRVTDVLKHMSFDFETYGNKNEQMIIKVEQKPKNYLEQEEVEEYDEQYYGKGSFKK